MTDTPNTVILPGFEVENQWPLPSWLSLKEMLDTLVGGGFEVKQVFDVDGQILHPEINHPPPNDVRFEVALPVGWSLKEGYDGYGTSDRTLQHLLDAQGHLRGHVCLDWDDQLKPTDAKLYCRYALNPLNCHTASVERPKGSIVDVVLDRAAVDPRQPARYPVVVQVDVRPARKGPLFDQLKEADEEDSARVKAGKPKINPPIYQWLNEHYPDWRNPFAYW